MRLGRGLLPIELPVSRELLSMYQRRGGNSRVLDRDEQIEKRMIFFSSLNGRVAEGCNHQFSRRSSGSSKHHQVSRSMAIPQPTSNLRSLTVADGRRQKHPKLGGVLFVSVELKYH